MSYEKYDSLNFLKLSEGKKQELKYFSILKDTLICDVYFNSDDGYFYFGKIAVNKDKDIILILGAYKYYGNFISIPVYSRLRFKIYMPEKFKINRIYSQWIDWHSFNTKPFRISISPN